jgi:ABC-2 type transport system permease protein
MNVLAIGWVNVVRMMRDKTGLFFVFLLPVVIIVVLGLMYGGRSAPRLGITSTGSGALGAEMVQSIRTGEVRLEIKEFPDEAGLRDAVERGTVELGMVVPAGYNEAIRSGADVTVTVVGQPNGALVIRQAVTTAVARWSALVEAARLSVEDGATFDGALAKARAAAAQAAGVDVTTSDVGERIFPVSTGMFALGAQSQLILFMFLTSMTAATQLILTRKLGVSRRMYSTPTSAVQIILGEAVGRFAVAMIQGVFIVLLSALVFGVGWGNPLGASAVVISFALVGTAAAMAVGVFANNADQAGTIGVFVGMIMGFLGGAMVPLELFSGPMRTVAYFTPHAWAIDGLRTLVFEGGGPASVAPQVGMLLLFALVPLVLAAWRFRRTLAA